jgi:hypothetical protein
MKPTELDFLKRMFARVEGKPYGRIWGFWEDEPLPDKQWAYYLEKWCKKGWYEFGVSLRGGWFTPEGAEAITRILNGESFTGEPTQCQSTTN